MTRFKDIDIYRFGNEIQITGATYSDGERNFVCLLPQESAAASRPVEILEMDTNDWQALIFQTDRLNVQFANGSNEKAVFSKSARFVNNTVSWAVFRRDGFQCRYCGADAHKRDLPLTVDHLVLWEQCGPWTMENLVTCCKADNKKRGNLPYDAWLKSDHYKRVSQNLTPEVRAANEALLGTLDSIPRLKNPHSRGG